MADRFPPIRHVRKLTRLPNVDCEGLFVSTTVQENRKAASTSDFRCENNGYNYNSGLVSEKINRLPPILENNDKPLTKRISENGSSFSSTTSHVRSSRPMSSSASKDESLQPPNFVFDPDGNVVFYWTCLTSLAVLYNYWIIILRVAFQNVHEQEIVRYLDTVSDVIYLSDITLQFRTGYLMDGIPIFDVVKLRKYYMKQNVFIRDVIAILPITTVISVFSGNIIFPECSTWVINISRFNRLLKLHTLYKFYDLADSRTSNPNCLRAFKLSLTLVIVIHWIGCVYYAISEYEGLGINNWVYTNQTDKQKFWRKYIVCMYWSAMTLTTIGESNPPETDVEYIFTGLTFLIGVFVFATVVGNVGDVVANINATRQEFQARMDKIKIYLTHKKVPPSLQIKVKKWAEFSWSRTQATDESRLLHMLPERLRAEIAVHVHLDTLRKVKIFEQCEHGFLCELVLKLKSQIYSPGDYICKAGETGREMYVINHGRVEVVNAGIGGEVVVACLQEGDYFGEISLLRLDGVQNRRIADVRSVGYSELLCLSRKDLMSALIEYPEAKTILESQAKERIRTNIEAKRTFSVDTFLENGDEIDRITGRYYRDEKRKEIADIRATLDELKQYQATVAGQRINELNEKCEQLQSQIIIRENELKTALQLISKLKAIIRHQKSRKYSVTSHRLKYKRESVRRNTIEKQLDYPQSSSYESEGSDDGISKTETCMEKRPISVRFNGNDVIQGDDDCFETAKMDDDCRKIVPRIVVEDDILINYNDLQDYDDPLRFCLVERCRRRCSSLTSLSETSNSRRSSFQSSVTNSDPED